MAGHELVEAGILAATMPGQHLVEVGEHLLQPCLRLRAHRLHRAAHLLERLRRQARAQTVEQGLEATLGLLRHEPVLLQGGDLAGEVVRQQVEVEALLLGSSRGLVGAGAVAVPLGGAALLDLGEVDGVALLVDDVGELAGDLVVDAAEIEALEAFPARFAQPAQQLAEPGDAPHHRRPRSPSFISRRSAALTSPCSIRSSVIAARTSSASGSKPRWVPSQREYV